MATGRHMEEKQEACRSPSPREYPPCPRTPSPVYTRPTDIPTDTIQERVQQESPSLVRRNSAMGKRDSLATAMTEEIFNRIVAREETLMETRPPKPPPEPKSIFMRRFLYALTPCLVVILLIVTIVLAVIVAKRSTKESPGDVSRVTTLNIMPTLAGSSGNVQASGTLASDPSATTTRLPAIIPINTV